MVPQVFLHHLQLCIETGFDSEGAVLAFLPELRGHVVALEPPKRLCAHTPLLCKRP